MISRWVRTWDSKVLQPLVGLMDRLGIQPTWLTIGGLVCEIAAGVLFATGHMAAGLGGLLLGQILDSLDGELARFQEDSSAFGAFLDSICDHYGDFAVYAGFLWYYLSINTHRIEVVLLMAAAFGSVFGSLVRARAGMAGVDTKRIGMFTRFERTVVIVLGIILGQLGLAFAVLALFTNVSALQRIFYTARASRQNANAIPRGNVAGSLDASDLAGRDLAGK